MSGTIEALTAALEANTAIQTKVLAALQKGGGAGAAAAAGTKAAADKPAAATGKPAAGKPKKKTVEDIAAAFSGYLGIKDKDEREVRKTNVKAIVDYFGAAKATEIPEESFEEALGYLQQYIDGETPEFAGGGDEGEDEGALV